MTKSKRSCRFPPYHRAAPAMTSQQADEQEMTLVQQLYEQESEEEDVMESDDEDLQYFKEPNIFCQLLRTQQCSACLYLWLVLCILASIVALIVVSIQVVGPFQRVQDFKGGTCVPIATVTLNRKSCLCGIACHAKYRCISIQVTYKDHNKVYRNATLYEDESTLENDECSYYPECKSSRSQTEAAVHRYESLYAVRGLPFNCLFSHHNYVIRSRRYQLYHVVNGILWPSMILVLMTGGLVAALRSTDITSCTMW